MATPDSMSFAGSEAIVDGVLESADSRVVAVNPQEEVLRQVSLSEPETEVTVLADESTAKSVFDDFIAASNAAESVRDGVLELYATPAPEYTSLFVTEEFYVSVVQVRDDMYGVVSTSNVSEVWDTVSDSVDETEEYELTTPPFDTLMESLEESVEEEYVQDFRAFLDSVERLDHDHAGLDVVEAVLLVGAKNETLLHDLSLWGEENGLASKATYSRAKSRLEDAEMIGTVKVPIDVGRPRLRLHFHESVGDLAVDEMSEMAQERFENR